MAQPASNQAVAQDVPQDAYGQVLPWNFQRVGRVLNALGTLWIIALMLLINTDVLGRNLFNAPVRGVTELVALSIVGIVFLQLADTLHSGRFTRADVLLDRLKRRRPALAARLQALYHLVGAALMVSSCGPPGGRWSRRSRSANTWGPSATSPRRSGRCA